VSEGRYGAVKRTVSAMLTRKKEQDRFIVKSSYVAFLGASVQYLELDRDAALKLKAALDDALGQMS
jgi:hypothetical protein